MNDFDEKFSSFNFAGLQFRGRQAKTLFPELGKFKFIVTVNADFVVIAFRNQRFTNLISNNFATIDGQITLWLARLLGKPSNTTIEKISGSSFSYELLKYAKDNNLRVFFLGALPSVNDLAIKNIKIKYDLDVKGFSPSLSTYPFLSDWKEDVLSKVLEYSPHILFVALGTPKQEYWIEENADALELSGVQIAIGCGGTLDFLAGSISRAPLWLQKSGFEGLYRLALQPSWFRLKRLARSLLIFPIAFYFYLKTLFISRKKYDR